MEESLDELVAGLAPRPPGGSGPGPGGSAEGGGPPQPPGRAVAAAALGTVFSRWEELVGPAVARHTRPLRLEGGVLVVAVDRPPWATQVRLLSPGILACVTERTGERLERLDVVVRPFG
ncbi:MAG: DUF721 domain-containing protein [Actinomycetota bacterium]|nr:DUF721 domain-containing protein [Actinomycetota bacterium]